MEIVGVLVAGGLVGGVVGWLLRDRKVNVGKAKEKDEIAKLKEEKAKLEGQLEQVGNAQKLLDKAKTELRDAFDATARKALQDNRDDFLGLANENLGKQLASAKGEFEKRHGEFQALVTPLSEGYGKLSPQIERLTTQTAKLSGALTNNRQVGNWGEVQLRRVVEIAGMVSYCDFAEQASAGESGNRPDMLIKLPNNRTVVVDAKASLAAYLAAQEAPDAATADEALTKHAAALKRQVDNLANKKYGASVTDSLDFVVMFVPGDQFLGAALEANPKLIEYGMTKGVAIATPASLIALLWTIYNGWRRYRIAASAQQIHDSGMTLYKRICKFAEHNEDVGKRLSEAINAYNRSVGSFDRRVVPEGRRFAKLTHAGEDDLPLLTTIEGDMRPSMSTDALPSESDALPLQSDAPPSESDALPSQEAGAPDASVESPALPSPRRDQSSLL